jgi:hypothetical protein
VGFGGGGGRECSMGYWLAEELAAKLKRGQQNMTS